jgi:hypothetical protein
MDLLAFTVQVHKAVQNTPTHKTNHILWYPAYTCPQKTMCSWIHAYIHSHIQAHMYAHACGRIYTCRYAYIQMHTHKYIYLDTNTYLCRNIFIHTQGEARTTTQTSTHTRTPTCTHNYCRTSTRLGKGYSAIRRGRGGKTHPWWRLA